MPKRTVKLKSFVWHDQYKDYTGEDRTRVVQSKRGEVIEVSDEVAAYGDDPSIGAFMTAEDEAAQEAQVVDVTDMDHEEMVDWVSESTIPQILTVAKANPELAPDLLEAENAATGNDARTGLADGLAVIIGDGEPGTSSDEGEEEQPDEVVEPEEEESVGAAADRLGVDLSKVEGSGEDDEVTLDDVKDYYDEEMADATDGAIELAESKDIYLADVTGTGKDGRIGKPDVEKYISDQEEQASS